MNVLCISIDGLHGGMIGALGNAWIQTPAMDELACRSLLFDRYRADSLQTETIFHSLWQTAEQSLSLAERFGRAGGRTMLLTDDDEVFFHAAADFEEKHRLELPTRVEPAQEVDETQFFRAMASVVQLLESADTPNPCFLWTHLRGFRGLWDFPHPYREQYRDEEDPEPYAGTAPPERTGERTVGLDPDEVQAVMEAYAGGITVLDDALAGLLDWFVDSRFAKDTVLVFLSTRGFSLGEHGRIGANELLYGENIQLPLFLCFPDGFEAGFRHNTLFTPKCLCSLLAAVADGEKFAEAKTKLQNEPETEDTLLRLDGDHGEAALLTDEWFLRRAACAATGHEAERRYELYVKPDDYWEINDVADRCPEILEKFVPLFAPPLEAP